MTEVWELAAARRAEFDTQAVAYDRYRPRYPEQLFDALHTAVGGNDPEVVETSRTLALQLRDQFLRVTAV